MFPVYIRNDDFGREEPPEDEDDWTLVDLQNKPSWSRIEANCPGITALVASETSWDPYVDAERLGRVLAANTRVKRFALVQHRVTQKAPFLRGLAPNRSIEHLGLQGCAFAGEDTAWLQYLRAFLEGNGSLHSLDWRGDWRDCREGGGGDWSALVNTLSKLNESVATCMLRDIRICDETAGDIVNALAANRNLSTLTFVKSNLGAGACTALGNWLQSPGCQLKHLDVQGNAINDKGVGVLVDALARNDTLRVLSLANNEQISPRGWRLFASSYAKSSGWAVQSLCLRGNKIGDGEIYSLGGAFAMSPFLRELDVSCNVEITEDGWVAFLACLAGDATTNMTSIELSGNRINDRAMTALGNVLTGRSSLVTLGLGCIGNVSLDGWREFSVALRSPTSKLEKIALENGITTDASLAALANGLANNSTVRSIDLSLKCTSPFAESMEAMDSVSSAGWQAFFTSLRNSKSVLEKLHLRSRPTFDDQAMAALRMPTLFERKKNGGNPQTVLVDQCPYANVVPDAVEKVKEFYANHSEIKASHGWKEHVSVVFDHAEKALLSLECSLPPKEEMEVKLAALLHDVDDRKFFPDACPVTYPNARAILELVGISSGEEGDTSNNSHERIIQMISWVGCSENGNSVPEEVKKNETYHLLIPRWADRLEAVGAKGVVRCYQYNQERGRPLCSDKSPRPTSEEELWSYAPPERLQEYMDRGGTSTDMISHYYDKLLHIARPPKDIVRNPYLEKMAVSSSKDLVDVCLRFGRLGAVDEDHIMALMNETR